MDVIPFVVPKKNKIFQIKIKFEGAGIKFHGKKLKIRKQDSPCS